MSYFYTHAALVGDNVLIRGYRDGERFQDKIHLAPYLFIPDVNGQYETLTGHQKLKKKRFTSVRAAHNFTRQFEDVSGVQIFGNPMFLYQYLNDQFPTVEFDPELVNIISLDIEVSSVGGYANVDLANKEITAISLSKPNKTIVFGTKPYKVSKPDVEYVHCDDERDLLIKLIEVWNTSEWMPDVITGWNVQLFDIRYLVNRIRIVLGETPAEKLSPWRVINNNEVHFGKKTIIAYELLGIVILDYLEIYKKFSLVKRESYTLDYVAKVEELEVKKLDYKAQGYKDLDDLYDRNHQLFIDYNIDDTVVINKLEEKCGFLQQILTLAYTAKVNYLDTLGTVRTWDVIITNYLLNERQTVVPFKQNKNVNNHEIIGGYVKEVTPGEYKWVMTFDLTSLYPHLIMMFNISPETFAKKIDSMIPIKEQAITGIKPDFVNKLKHYNLTAAANGCLYTREFQGVYPKLMEMFFNNRKIYKDKMIAAKKEFEKTKNKEFKKVIARYNNLQNAFKTLLNSAYGALVNEYFRFFDPDLGESITSSGQRTTMFTEHIINQYLNKLLKTTNVDYVVACDTDSVMVCFDALVEKCCKGFTNEQIVNFLDKVAEEKILPLFQDNYEKLAEMTNAYQQKMHIKREAIASKGIWTAVKRYILNVYDNEGVRFKEPELKITGIEAIRSSTPHVIRDKIKESLKIIMNGTEQQFNSFVSEFKQQFLKSDFNTVAFPRTCNNLEKYTDSASIYKKASPIQVRGALIYNHYLNKTKLQHKYKEVNEGDKIKFAYLKMPNPVKDTVISVPDELPTEFDLEKYVDKEMQFQKAFAEPMNRIVQHIGWNTDQSSNLKGLFE